MAATKWVWGASDASKQTLAPSLLPSPWGTLDEHVLRLILQHLDSEDLAAAHLVSRSWHSAVRLSVRALGFKGVPPDTEQLKQVFPHVATLKLECMDLRPHNVACIAGLTRLTKLQLRLCHLKEGACLARLQSLQLQELDLCEVLGSTPEALDDAIRGMTNLHRLHVESCSSAGRTPSLRSLAFLPRMRQLSVKHARPQPGLEGLSNLQALSELEALDLSGAGVSNAIMTNVSELVGLTQLRVPEAPLVTEQGFQALAGLTVLQELDLSCWRPQTHESIGDAGAAHLALLSQLTSLNLAGRSAVTATGLTFLRTFSALSYLNLSRVKMDSGDASFLWHLAQLSHLELRSSQMKASQFIGLPNLMRLVKLGVSGTQFDDDCCCHLARATNLRSLDVAHTRVTSAGIKLLNASHPYQLHHLRLDGCRVSMSAVLSTLRCQPPGACFWDKKHRGHLPRFINVLNLILVTATANDERRLRLRHAPEASMPQQVLMCALVGGILATQLLMLATATLVLLVSPVGVLLGSIVVLLLFAAGTVKPHDFAIVAGRAAVRAEIILSAALVGILGVHVPVPPPPPYWN